MSDQCLILLFKYSATEMPYEMHKLHEMLRGSALPWAQAAAAHPRFHQAFYVMHPRHMSAVCRLLVSSHYPGTGREPYPREVQQHTNFAGMSLNRHLESHLESLLNAGTGNTRLSARVDASMANMMPCSLWRLNTIRRRSSRSSRKDHVCERRSSTLGCGLDIISEPAWHPAIYPQSGGLIQGYQSREAAVSERRAASGGSERTMSMRFDKWGMNTSRGPSQLVFDMWPTPAPAMPVRGTRPGCMASIRDDPRPPRHPGLQNNAAPALPVGRPAPPILLDARPDKAPADGHIPRGDHR